MRQRSVARWRGRHAARLPAAARLRHVTGAVEVAGQAAAPAVHAESPPPDHDDGEVPEVGDEPQQTPLGRVRSGLDRLDGGRQGLAVVAVVALLAAAVAAALYWRSRPVSVPLDNGVPPVAARAPAATGDPAQRDLPAPGSPSGPAELVVDVAGKVRHPGVVRLPPGSRVADAVRAAGGPLAHTDLGLLNLAARLVDGEQVVVGAPAPPLGGTGAGVGADGSGAGTPVNLNVATAEQLDTLPGVGPVLAQRIVDYRTAHGPFHDVDALEQVPGIGPSKLSELRDLVTV